MNKTIITLLTVSAFMLSSCSIFQSNAKSVSVATGQSSADRLENKTQTGQKKTNKKSKKNADAKQVVAVSQQSHVSDERKIYDELLGGEWVIYEVNGEKIEGEERPYLYFNMADHRFYGSNGCNTVNGDFEVISDSMSLKNVISTQKACHDALYEYQINYALGRIVKFNLARNGNEYYMDLYDSNNINVLVLRKHNMDYLNGVWQVVGISGNLCDNKDLMVVIDIPELKLHGNTGCNVVNGQLLIDPDKENSIQFHQLITTRMICPDQSLETAFLVALEEVEAAKLSDNALEVSMFDNRGNEVLRLKKTEN